VGGVQAALRTGPGAEGLGDDADMGAWSYAYDALGNLARQTDAKSQNICLYYDTLNRLTGKHYRSDTACPTANPTLNVSYSYDASTWGKGRRTGMVDASGSTAWSYDARGRVTSETKTVKDGATVLGTYTTSWTYTSADRIVTMTYPTGEVVTSNYLPQGTLTQLTSSYGQVYLNSAAVDALGRPTVFDLGNGTQTKYTYYSWVETDEKQRGRLKKLQSGSPESLSGTASLQSFEYGYDWAGNITSIAQKIGNQSTETLSYTYDELNRLKTGSYSDSPTYNTNTGNLATKANKTLGYGAQAANCPDGALTKVHAATSLDGTTNAYCYDANGNMTRRKIGANTYTLSYDPENRLKQISRAGAPTYDYVYDGDGQRVLVKKQVGTDQFDKTIYIGGHFEVFIKASYSATPAPVPNCGVGRSCIYLPLNITTFINPTATAGQTWKSYYSTGAGQVVRVQDNAGMSGSGLFWLYADHLGSTTVTARMGGFEAELVSTLSYTAWGETRASSGTTPTSIRYTGQREAEAGLYFYKARWYDPALGRFAQADTIIPGQSAKAFDRYAYSGNNPVNFNDPTGHVSKSCDNGWVYNPTAYFILNLYGDPVEAINNSIAWFEAHPDYNLFFDANIWTVDNGILIPDAQYQGLIQAYYVWRNGRGESDLCIQQSKDQIRLFELMKSSSQDEFDTNLLETAIMANSLVKGGVYTLTDQETGTVVRTGRSNDLMRRELEHRQDPILGKYRFDVIYRTDSYAAQRGLEQVLYDKYKAFLNKIRPISPKNPKAAKYMNAAKEFEDKEP
jgi:RHS repeat-associated protein